MIATYITKFEVHCLYDKQCGLCPPPELDQKLLITTDFLHPPGNTWVLFSTTCKELLPLEIAQIIKQ